MSFQNDSASRHPLIQRAFTSVPIAQLIGFSVEEIGNGRAVGLLETRRQHTNPMGTVHGGILCDLADAAMGMAFASTLKDEESFTTLDLHISFLRPVWETELRAEAWTVHRGKNIGHMECEIKDVDGKLVAKASSKCFVLRGEAAKGR